jgi:hypothetical protein
VPRSAVRREALGPTATLPAVFVTLTRAKTSEHPIEDATIVAEEMERWLCDLEGFEGFVVLSRKGTSIGLTFWESHEVAERYGALRSQFRERILTIAGVEIEEVVDYQLTYAKLSDRVGRDPGDVDA